MDDPNNLRNFPPVVDGEDAEVIWQREGQVNQGPLNDAGAPGVRVDAAPGLHVSPRRVTLGEHDASHTYYRNRSAIIPPPIQRKDYEIKPQIIALVKQNQFHGLSNENPMDHIDIFEEICSVAKKANGVPQDYFLFHSLTRLIDG